LFAAFYACIGLFYIFIGIVMGIGLAHLPASSAGANGPPPAFVGWLFGGMGLVFFLLAGAVAFLRYWAAKCVKRRTWRTFCMVMAGIGCLEIPYGTALGVLSLIVLGRPSVERLFEGGKSGAAA
jgi:cbb3-type cytochrome oxidase subunit 1